MSGVLEIMSILIFFSFLQTIVCDNELSFENCASSDSQIELHDLSVDGCTDESCEVKIGDTLNITMVLDTNVTVTNETMTTSAVIIQMGFNWKLSVTPEDPCLEWSCPLKAPRRNIIYSLRVKCSDVTMRRPGIIKIVSNKKVNPDSIPPICVKFWVDLV
ncbi:hypothetical protein JTB14_007924 [Gonioctena quinquepunctata]|nr:hypothetical protein JTB14_007924 [Gonioctena quinquepunctata]